MMLFPRARINRRNVQAHICPQFSAPFLPYRNYHRQYLFSSCKPVQLSRHLTTSTKLLNSRQPDNECAENTTTTTTSNSSSTSSSSFAPPPSIDTPSVNKMELAPQSLLTVDQKKKLEGILESIGISTTELGTYDPKNESHVKAVSHENKFPTVVQLEEAINMIRKENTRTRWMSNTVLVLGSIFVILMCARETDNMLWTLATNFCVAYLEPETAHMLVMNMGKRGLLPTDTKVDDPFLKNVVCGIPFPNPIGLAAGFDKSCDAPLAFGKMGFGSVEVGTVTPYPQEGNPKPRIFRLVDDRAIINRCGFNNDGIDAVYKRLKNLSKQRWKNELTDKVVFGVNIGKNKLSDNPVWDYVECAKRAAPFADYLVLNVSSPNTPGLRQLQRREELTNIVKAVQGALDNMMLAVEQQREGIFDKYMKERIAIEGDTGLDREEIEEEFRYGLPTLTGKRPPLFIKISPDLTEEEKIEIATVVKELKIDGLVVSNTTVGRPTNMRTKCDSLVAEQGGLSGYPLKNLSTNCVKDMYKLLDGKVPIIAVGGIMSGSDAMEKIEAGASLVQIYSALVYGGPAMTRRIKIQLGSLMYSKGYTCIQDAIGAAHKEDKKKKKL